MARMMVFGFKEPPRHFFGDPRPRRGRHLLAPRDPSDPATLPTLPAGISPAGHRRRGRRGPASLGGSGIAIRKQGRASNFATKCAAVERGGPCSGRSSEAVEEQRPGRMFGCKGAWSLLLSAETGVRLVDVWCGIFALVSGLISRRWVLRHRTC